MSIEVIIAGITLLLTFIAGIWKMGSMLGGVQATVTKLEVDLQSNTVMTKEVKDKVFDVSERVAKLEGARDVHDQQRTYPGVGRLRG